MVQAIPAAAYVSVNPGVIGAGGTGAAMIGLALTPNGRVPIGQPASFANAAAVLAYFGPGNEATFAATYFQGFDGSNVKPANLLFAQYNAAPVAGFLRGGNVSSLTLAQLQAISGTISLTVDGTPRTSSALNLSGAASFTAAAALIATALGAGVTVVYDSQSGAFLITSSTTGAASQVSAATVNATASSLGLTVATGAVVSPGAIAAVPATFMTGIISSTQGFATFGMVGFEPATSVKLAFAAWNSLQNNDYIYVGSDSDVSPLTTVPAASSFGYQVLQAGYSGTYPIIDPLAATTALKTAATMGFFASVDYTQTNGRTTMAFRTQSGLLGDVNTQTAAQNVVVNGYNYLGAVGSATTAFNFMYPGSISGPFKWADSYQNQIKLTADLQSALLNLLMTAKSVPYNQAGYTMIESACLDPINSGLNFGSIRAGVALSASQIAQVNAAAGTDVATTLSQRGWYLQVVPAPSAVRIARTTPAITLFYMDGQSVQQINVAAIEVQ